MEDLFFFGGIRGIHIPEEDLESFDDFSDFSGVVARCQFGWNQIAVDVVDTNALQVQLAIRDCKIRSGLGIAPGGNDPPNLLDPCIGIRLHAIGNTDENTPARIDVEIRNLETIGEFDEISPTTLSVPGTGDLNSNNEFSRLVEVFTEASGHHFEHAASSGFDPIPQVNVEFIGGQLDGMADASDTDSGWDVGVFATTGVSVSTDLKDFGCGYSIETSGSIFDGFRLAGIHAVTTRWGRGEVTLNGNTVVRETGRQATATTSTEIYSGIHMYCEEAYLALATTGAKSLENTGHGVYLKTKSSINADDHAAPTGNFLNLDGMQIHENERNGLALEADTDGIVGGAWHFVSNAKSLRKMSGITYSVNYGQGIVDGCSISNNGECGLYFRAPTSACFVSTRFINTVVWNNPNGGYFADLSNGDSEVSPVFLVPLAHCTFAGNGSSSAYSLEIVEASRSDGDKGIYYWTGAGGALSTKFYNTIFERQSSGDDDFSASMFDASDPFLVDDGSAISSDEIGVAGVRYQDGGTGVTPFALSTRDATPFVNTSAWTTLDASHFYLANLGGGAFGQTPMSLPLVGSESTFDHSGDLRPTISSGTRDKGAEEL